MLGLKSFKQCINVCPVSIVRLNISKLTYVNKKQHMHDLLWTEAFS